MHGASLINPVARKCTRHAHMPLLLVNRWLYVSLLWPILILFSVRLYCLFSFVSTWGPVVHVCYYLSYFCWLRRFRISCLFALTFGVMWILYGGSSSSFVALCASSYLDIIFAISLCCVRISITFSWICCVVGSVLYSFCMLLSTPRELKHSTIF